MTRPIRWGVLSLSICIHPACGDKPASSGANSFASTVDGGTPPSTSSGGAGTTSSASNGGAGATSGADSGGSAGSDSGGSDSGGGGASGGNAAEVGGAASGDRPDWVGDGNCRASYLSATTCSQEYPEQPYQYLCVLGAMDNVGPAPDCVNPSSGTLSGATWCCEEPLCTRTPTTDGVCSSPTPYSYSCPLAETVPSDCTTLSNGAYCCP